MSKNVVDVLKEATKDILSEQTLNEIQQAFEASVNEKVKIHVEKALSEQDEDHSKKLEALVEAIDKDHVAKLNKVVSAIDENHSGKLKAIVEKYQGALSNEAKSFKKETINDISTYLEAYLDEVVPAEDIKKAVANRKANDTLAKVRNLLAVDAAIAQESIREAVLDGKKQLDEARKELESAKGRVVVLEKELNKAQASLLLEQKTRELPENKKKFIHKLMGNKDVAFINENYDYTLKLFNKTEEERLSNIRDEAAKQTETVDRVVVEEAAAEKPASNDDDSTNGYLSELSRW
ncbi:hypothetical protein EBR43_08565 [bacterium]|nr:hypothetical protein [bacterium]